MADRRVILPDFITRRLKRDEAKRLIDESKTLKPYPLETLKRVSDDIPVKPHKAKERVKRRAANKRARQTRKRQWRAKHR